MRIWLARSCRIGGAILYRRAWIGWSCSRTSEAFFSVGRVKLQSVRFYLPSL